ncbi:MAG: type II secretion system F family protein [Phycisphaerae bacterium]|nr:type II secretion system F family protein [Phycisphaerae bacterium]
MNAYRYIARDSSTGERIEGVMQADTTQEILGWLHDKALTPLAVEPHIENIEATEKKVRGRRRFRVRSQHIASFCWQLNTMLKGGVPITEAIATIDIDNLTFRLVLLEIVEKLKSGETFTGAVQEYPKIFNNFFCAMVLAGESSGTLTPTLARLADYYERRDALRQKVKQAMTYPLFAIGFVMLIVGVMMVSVVPRFLEIFEEFENTLPPVTLAFMQFYDFMRENIICITALIAAAILALVFCGRTPCGNSLCSRLVLRLPLVGKLLTFAFVVRFGRTMGTLLTSGVPAPEALSIICGMSRNKVVCETLDDVYTRVIEGEPIARSMRDTRIFPRLVAKTVQVGEDSGSLPEVLEHVSVYYERKVDSAIQAMLIMLEPVLIIVVGAIVMFVLLALYMPIFSMSHIGDSI